MEKMIPELQAVVNDPNTDKIRKMEGIALINKVERRIHLSKLQS